ncbi:zeatin o-glucosyltransferase [Phtheirospermum japonicum]|uniref:Glycosyltransferase n=1 Tax=Phtheirospermum japonicum TaxID=374723 RepID=A0A830BVG8_9LAMI|nr:zeatin o-glucosyltransferase [Phtheirospermum japonicum]
MVPFAAQGHLNQLLQLSCLVSSSYKIPVYYVTSPIFTRQAKSRINGLNPLDVEKIHFHEIPTPQFDSPPPDPKLLHKFPTQLLPAWYASLNLREPFAGFLKEMSVRFKRVVVIHDPAMDVVVQDIASISNAESYAFNCISAYSHISILHHGLQLPVSVELPKELPSFDGCLPDELNYLAALKSEPLNLRSGDLYNTCRSIEAPYMDILENKEISGNRKVWAIGPILPTKSLSSGNRHNPKCLEWLDKHEPNSVIYVSFGTTVSLEEEQIKELALGLEQSKVKFLLVLRDADKGNVFDGKVRQIELPEGFEERVEGIGMVERDWAPQPQILAHPSTGGFMSHCGWNSCVESIRMGVPIAAWPMHSDQPANTVLVTDILKMGLVVREWKQRMELVRASSVVSVVRRLMASEEGNGIRKRAEEVRDIVGRATQDGGVSRAEMDSFVAHISR